MSARQKTADGLPELSPLSRACASVCFLGLLLLAFCPLALAESGSSASYRLDYGRLTSDSDQKTSASYKLTDAISDISAQGDSASFNLKNVYASHAGSVGPVCGNGAIETGEQCDGTNFGGPTCASYGYNGGTLQCVGCLISTAACSNAIIVAGPAPGGGGISGTCNGPSCHPTVLPPVTTPPSPQQKPQTPTPSATQNPLTFQPEFNPNLPFEIGKPQAAQLPGGAILRPSAPTQAAETTVTEVMGIYDYHFEDYRPGQVITMLDETPFVVTKADPDQIYEMTITDETGKVVTRQGVQSTDNSVLMFESIPFLKYGKYAITVYNKNHEVYKYWDIVIEHTPYREHDNLSVGSESNREHIDLGTFEKMSDISGIGEPNSKYYAYLQPIEKQDGKISDIQILKAQTGTDGKYQILLPNNPKDGSYLLQVVQVHKDGKISRNKRYVFSILTPHSVHQAAPACNTPPTKTMRSIWVLIAIALGLLCGQAVKDEGKKKRLRSKIFFALALILSLVIQQGNVLATVTTPSVFIYEGKLLDSTNNPITTAQTFRFSLWSSNDKVVGDVTGAGAINVAAPTYGGWFETDTLTPNSDGTFFVALGNSTPLPNMLLANHKFLQVEIKPFGSLDTSYELIDPTGDNGADTTDRQTIGSTPYTNNADFIDNAELGTGAGNIATLGFGGVWDTNYMPGATNSDSWTIDNNDTVGAGGNIDLVFGKTLNQTLAFDVTNDWFSFSNDVNLGQHEIKNVALDNLAAAPGSPVPGQIFYNTSDNNTYIWNGTAWDNITAGTPGAVRTLTFNATYEDSVASGDGTDNRGTLTSNTMDIGARKYNYYEWKTLQPTLQDVNVQLSIKLPNDFVSFTATPLQIVYNTSDGNTVNNKVDALLYDTTNTVVPLVGGNNLANAAWTPANITFGGVPTFTAGGTITLVLKLSTINTGFARAADVVLEYNGS